MWLQVVWSVDGVTRSTDEGGIFDEIHTAQPAFLTVKEAPSTNKPKRIVAGAYWFFPRWGTVIGFQGDGTIDKMSFDNGVTPYVQFGHIDLDRDTGNDTGFHLTVGINYEIAPHFMVKLENNYFKGQSGTNLGAFPGGDYNEIKAAIVLGI